MLSVSDVRPTELTPVTLPELSTGQERTANVWLREEEIRLEKRRLVWERISTFASAGLTTMALIAAIGAWIRTGRPPSAPSR